jgi:mannosyltransferase
MSTIELPVPTSERAPSTAAPTTAASTSRVRFGIDRWSLAALMLSAITLVVRCVGITSESAWLDEAYTLLFSRLPIGRLIVVGGTHEHPPVYYLLTHVALLVHDSYVTPRYLSAIAGAASVFALYALGRRLHSPLVGLIAALLLVCAPVHLWNSQDGRAYELAGLAVLVSYLALLHAAPTRSPWRWSAYAAATLLTIYTDYTTAFVLLPQALFLVRQGVNRRFLLWSWCAVGLGYVPWLGLLLADTARVAGGYWVQPPTPSEVSTTILELVGAQTPCPTGTNCVPTALPLLGGPMGAALAVAVALAVVGAAAWSLARRRWLIGLLAAWAIAPFAILLAISVLRPLFLDRYVLGSTYALYLLAAVAVAEAWRRRSTVWKVIALVPVLWMTVAGLAGSGEVYAVASNPDWRTPVRDFSAAYRPGDAAIYYPAVLAALIPDYLPPRLLRVNGTPIWVTSYLDVPQWTRRYAGLDDYQLRDIQLTAITTGHPNIWVLRQNYPGDWDVWHWLNVHGYRRLMEETFHLGTHLELWTRRPASSYGPVVVGHTAFDSKWSVQGDVSIHGGVAVARGVTALSREFPVRPRTSYVVSISEHTRRLPEPQGAAVVYGDCSGPKPRDPLGVYPRVPHVDLWANNTWINRPFGFITPPHAACAVLHMTTSAGTTTWRGVGVERER